MTCARDAPRLRGARSGATLLALCAATACGTGKERSGFRGEEGGGAGAGPREAAGGDGGAGPPRAGDAGGPEAWIEIGDGAAGFAEIEPGAEVSLILGPQGGWMMFFAVRGDGFHPGDAAIPNGPDNPALVLTGSVQERQVATLTVRRAFPPAAPPASFAIAGLPLVLDAGLDASDVSGRKLELRAEVTDRDGLVLRAALGVVPVPADGAR